MKKFAIAAACVVSLASPALSGTLSNVYTSFYSFGDSLSDDGKLPDAALHPVSDDGRFSNGPAWAEYVAAEFDGTGKNTANLAIGGATGDDDNFRPINVLSTFAGQIATFANSVVTGNPLPVRTSETDVVVPQATNPGSNPLVSVLFGGNDMFQAVDTPTGPGRATLQGISVQKVLENAADRVADGIREIAGLLGGGVFDEFLLLTLPGGGLAEFYNNQLAANVMDLRSEGLKIINLDTDEVFGEIIGDALFNGGGVFGITDVTGACTASLNDPTGASCLDIGVDPNTIALVDSVHPNAVVHQVLGDRAISAVISTVPLPAGMPLMLVGLGAFAAMRKRRS